MSPPTYLARVQQALSDVVNEDKDTILHADLVRRIRPKSLRSSETSSSPFREGVRCALSHEINARRLFVNKRTLPISITITDCGIGFYAGFVQTYAVKRARARRIETPKDAALNSYLSLVELVVPIRNAVKDEISASPERWHVEKLPEVIRSYLETEETLRAENGTLIHQFNDVSFEADRLEEVLAHF